MSRLCLLLVSCCLIVGCQPADEQQVRKYTVRLPEPEYEGKPLSHWKGECRSASASSRQAAANALGEMGPNAKAAIPDLSELLVDKEAAVRKAAAEALGKRGAEAQAAIADLVGLLGEGTLGPGQDS
jgi:hypothetical protein